MPPPHVQYMCEAQILFEGSSTKFAEASNAILPDLLAGKGCPAWKGWVGGGFIVRGHADAARSHEANMALSLRRAEAVRDQLVSLGISRDLVQVVGYGDTQPMKSGGAWNNRAKVSLVGRDGKEMHFF